MVIKLRYLNEFIVAAVIFALFGIFISVYPVAGFYFNRYIHSYHKVDEGSYFIYYGILPGQIYLENGFKMYGFRLLIEVVGNNQFHVNLSLYSLTGNWIGLDPNKRPPFNAEHIKLIKSQVYNVDYNKSYTIKFLLMTNDSLGSNLTRFSFTEPNSTTYNPSFLGFTDFYQFILDWEDLSFVEIGNYKILVAASLRDMSFLGKDFDIVENYMKELSRSPYDMGIIGLVDGNTVPNQQKWLDGVIMTIGLAFPLPLVLFAISMILLIIGFRYGR